MKPFSYADTLEAIQSLAPRGWRMGLDRMEEFVHRAGLADSLGQESGPQYLHVTGTNGKGSVTAYLQSMLAESGYRTGAFYSPFVYDPRERWQLGREMISPDELAALATELWPIGESLSETDFGGVTEFEFKAALAFLFWKRNQCEWVALEVGLGGRLDATNVIIPRASVIVSIGLDHVNILGHSLAEIAYEKAGIIKPGRPLILGDVAPEARETILGVTHEAGSPVWQIGKEIQLVKAKDGWDVSTPANTYRGVQPGIPGHIQPHNAALAIAAMDGSGATRSSEAILSGAARANIPGRFQRILARDREWILDGAHNAPAALELRASLDACGIKGVTLLSGMVAGHEPADFYSPLADLVERAVFAPIQFHRALPAAQVARESGLPSPTHTDSIKAAIDLAADTGEGPILVTGRFYLLGEVAPLLLVR